MKMSRLEPPWTYRVLLLGALLLTGCQSGLEVATQHVARPPLPLLPALDVAAAAPLHWRLGYTEVTEDALVLTVARTDVEPARTVDLPAALERTTAANPTIARAREAVAESQAELTRARALWLPSLNAGANLRVHRGSLQNSSGSMRDVNLDSLYYGAGAGARGGSTVAVPGVALYGHVGDAWFLPKAAQERLAGRHFTANAVEIDVLAETASQYLELLGAQARLQASQQTRAELAEVARITANFAKAGQGRQSDAERARTELLLIQAAVVRIEEEDAVARAQVARLLSVEPALPLRGRESTPPLLELVGQECSLEDLLAQALANRPELKARAADVAQAAIRLRHERFRPWLPTIIAGVSVGEFGGGGGQAPHSFAGRADYDVAAVWTFQNFGMGNLAVQQQAAAGRAVAEDALQRELAQVRQQVAEAFALVQRRRADIPVAQRRLETSQQAYAQDLSRTRNLQGRPIEVLSSISLLGAARLDLIQATMGYSQAQVQLARAVGVPIAPR